MSQTTDSQDSAPASQSSSDAVSPEFQLDEIVVTAQKRSESLQKIPIAVTAFSGRSLEARGINNVLEVATLTPGLQLSNASGEVIPFLRGVGNTANPVGNEASVAVYVDGVYFSRLPSGFFSLANIERMEVLKGPQGTLFGRNSSGGVIQIITPDPSHSTSLRGHIGYGSFSTVHGDVYATTGLGEKAALDIAVAGTKQGHGYGRNITSGHRATFSDDFTARTKLLIELGDRTHILLSGFYAYARNGALGNTYPGTTQGLQSPPIAGTPASFSAAPPLDFYDQRSDLDNHNLARAWGGSLRVEQELGNLRLKSITAYLHDKEHQLIDGDYGPRPNYRADLFSKVEQITQELQLSNAPGERLSWIVGLFYYNASGKYDPLAFQGSAFFPNDVVGDSIVNSFSIYGRQRAKSYAGYAQATYPILPRLKITGGVRYTMDRLSGSGHNDISVANGIAFIPGPVVTGRDRTNKLTFKVAADYEFGENILGYASFSRGYKSSNFNLLPFSGVPNKPETLDAYEVGLKSELFNRRLRINAAIFRYDIGNPQVQLLNNGAVVLSNADSSRVTGVDLEGGLKVTRSLTMTFGATYLNSKYRRYLGAPSGPPNPVAPFGSVSPQIAIDASGNRTPMAAKLTAVAGLQYIMETAVGALDLSTDYAYNDGFFWEPDNFLNQKPYHLVNAQIRLRPSDKISTAAWVKNLVDEKIAVFAATQEGPSGYPFVAGPPRTYGVTLGFEF
ncbi:TonB-dependent receptor [Rhizorhapis suberifaciens]|uniref:Iron complex outermembrane receptor protein n=1 Tax=Rhizorhapis suberifaciens TaxID=13656 RepID=A0A840HW66_9SPHN|nr:TonB-dependent receptor [Rhizorhapis suberifaciens]MBB4642552.1 iron complex outermembrane receptor protein [Rhizorhapis suberifaciens]